MSWTPRAAGRVQASRSTCTANAYGRCDRPLLEGDGFGAGTYELVFHVGDYFAGSNHVLPTGGTARFSSALGVYDFLKRTSIVRYTEAELRRTAGQIELLARAEGFDAHARAATIRLETD